MVGGHLRPIGLLVERLRHDDETVAILAEIEGVCIVVLGEPESEEIVAIREGCREAHSLAVAILVDKFAKRQEHPRVASTGSPRSSPAPIIAKNTASESVVPIRDG